MAASAGAKYKRVLLKVSGEALMGPDEYGLHPATVERIADEIPLRPAGCYAIRNMTERRPLPQWRALGVTRADGGPLPAANLSAGLVKTDTRHFLVYDNYDAILGYNCAHYYALSVALLSERLR